MKSMKLGMIWVLVGMGLAMLLSVGVLGSEESVSAQDSTDPVLVGAGDIASCSRTGDEATASLLEGINGTVATFGDNAYESGTSAEFSGCYHPSWGRLKARTILQEEGIILVNYRALRALWNEKPRHGLR